MALQPETRGAATLVLPALVACSSADPGAPSYVSATGAGGSSTLDTSSVTLTTGNASTTSATTGTTGTTGMSSMSANSASVTTGGMTSAGTGGATGAPNTAGGQPITGTETTGNSAGGMMGGSMTTGSMDGSMVPGVPYCEPTMSWDPEWAQLEQEILEIVNQVRAEGATCGGQQMPPVGPLMMDPNLQCAARMHSLDMDDRNFFSHDNPNGEGPSERMDAAGYMGRGWGENIAAGSASAEGTMNQWMNSAGHCRNIMSDGYTMFGVGYHPGGEYGHLWTQTFGG